MKLVKHELAPLFLGLVFIDKLILLLMLQPFAETMHHGGDVR